MELYQIKTEHPVVGYCESRIGGRSENQDSYGYHDTPFGLLIVVCDGMGGGPAGKTASSMAVSEILAGVMECEVDTAPKDVLQKAIQRANRALLDAIDESPELSGMGTTCTALLLNEHSAIMAHVGDSRIYQLRHHGKVFRTFDHSLVFDLVKQKVITEEQARLSDQSNIITRALGMKPELEIDIEERPYKKGDRFLLCTDGIHGTMPEKELMALATQRGELGNVVDGIAAMVDGNGKKNGGGHDNLTLVIVETKEKSELKEKMKSKTTLILGIIAATLAVIALVLNSCKNEDIDVDTFRIAEEQVLTGVDTVGITGTYDFFKEAEAMKINIGRDSTLADASSHAVSLVGKDYSAVVRNLQANTQYYYNYSVNVGVHNDFITPTKSFRTLQAQDFTIVVSAIPNEGGTVSGGGTYTQGQQCTVTASAHEGYTFMHWTENDSVVSTDSIYRFVVTGNRVLAAQFALLITEPTVTTGEVTDITQTTAKGSGEVNNDGGAAVTERGLCWSTSHNPTVLGNHATSGTGIGTFSVDMSGLTANTKYYVRAYATNSEGSAYGDEVEFTTSQLNNYTVSISANPTNGGTATGGGSFQQGQSCTVRATANTGYTFVNWTESGNQVSANANYTFTVNDNRTLVANFTAGSYIISATVDPENSGTITGAGGYEYGQSCTLKATANTGYTFEKWTENGTQVSTNATYTFSVSGSRSLVAHFKVNSYTITVSANPVAGGVAIGGGTFEYGQSCTLSATANSGYNFSNWTEGGNVVSSNSSYTFTVTGNRTLKANFTQQAPQNYTISVSANPSDGGTVTGGGTYQQGQSCTVRAIANSGYTFSKWTENGNQVSTSANYTFTVTGNRTLVAHFTANPQNYTISVSADPTNGGSVSGGGSYQQGQNCTVTAAANSGYTFSSWTENGNVVSSNPSYSFIVTGNRTLVAHFIANPQNYTITVTANPTNGGTVNGGGTYQQWQSCTVSASANSGYTFTNWTENGNVVSTNADYTFSVTGNRSLVAHFLANQLWPNGVLPGTFSVSSTKQVHFSQGNLQYQASTNTWRFAEMQWGFVGGTDFYTGELLGNVYENGIKCDNLSISSSYDGWIDLFGWGTSGWNNGNVYYYPWNYEKLENQYQGFGYGPTDGISYEFDLNGTYSNSDWGIYNSIQNGGNVMNAWRTLTINEWQYLIDIRNTASNIRFAKAMVENVPGVILLPDDWMQSIYALNNTNQGEVGYDCNVIEASQWVILENAGAVFLPAAGSRSSNTDYGCYSRGYYWSINHEGPYGCARKLEFDNDKVSTNYAGAMRCGGRSVRLVQDY